MRRLLAGLGMVLLLAPSVRAQELEPRAYSNVPAGMNFLVAGYAHSQGGLSTEPSLPLSDAELRVDTALLAYARALDLWGKSGKFDLIVPYSHLHGTARVAGQPAERQVSGFGDPRLRVSVNLHGAPSLSLAEYAGYRPDLVIGASVQVGVPVGQYDPSRAINLGTNRWTIKPDLGFSQAFSSFTFDLTAGVTFFGRNDDYFGGRTLEQAPLYSTQAHLSYDFGRGLWAALGATYYWGGRTTVNDVLQDNALNNSRVGLTLAVPVDRRYSFKFNVSRGISVRTGTDFTTAGLALQYRWGAGL